MNNTTQTLQQNITAAKQAFDQLAALSEPIDRAARLVGEALANGRKLLACGNGGSAADAAHLTTEFVCRFDADRPPYPAICLTTQGGDLTAIGNDYAFDELFARQVRAFGAEGDVLVAISTSGNSANVRRAIQAGRDVGLHTIALLGRDGGACADLAEVELLCPGENTARIQEVHILVIHTVCQIVEQMIGTMSEQR